MNIEEFKLNILVYRNGDFIVGMKYALYKT